MADTDIVEILQSQRENKTRANTAIKKLSRGTNHQVISNFFGPAKFQLANSDKIILRNEEESWRDHEFSTTFIVNHDEFHRKNNFDFSSSMF